MRAGRAAVGEDIWPLPSTRPAQPDPNQKGGAMSDFMISSDYFMKEELQEIRDEVNREYWTDAKLPDGSVF